MRVRNVWDLRVPVVIEYKGTKITIPHDQMVYFLPDELRGHKFKGLLEVIPDDVELKKHHPKLFHQERNESFKFLPKSTPKVEPLVAFPNDMYDPDAVQYPDYDPPAQNIDSFPTYQRDKDDPNVLVDSRDLPPPTITELREDMKNGEKPLKGIKVNQKLKDAKRKERKEKYHRNSIKIL